jgi:hypothetical protein
VFPNVLYLNIIYEYFEPDHRRGFWFDVKDNVYVTNANFPNLKTFITDYYFFHSTLKFSTFPQSLENLRILFTEDYGALSTLPSTLKTLHLNLMGTDDNNPFDEDLIDALPNLQSLSIFDEYLYYTTTGNLGRLPKNLQHLKIECDPNLYFYDENQEEEDDTILTLDHLPAGLQSLHVNVEDYKVSVEYLPQELKSLTIRGVLDVHFLDHLPRSLVYLAIQTTFDVVIDFAQFPHLVKYNFTLV